MGAWFDGKSSQKHFVEVELTPQGITLKTPGNKPAFWAYSHIHWTARTSPFNIECRIEDENGKRTETLVVEDLDFYASVLRIAPENFSTKGKEPTFNWKFYSAGILVLILFAFLLIKTVPSFLANQMVEKIPVQWEVTLGQSLLDILPIKKNPDQKIIMVLQDTVDLLVHSGSPSPYDIRVYISPVKRVNALALPGGPIVVFEGLLHEAESPEELAGVLAHEIQHIQLRHSTNGIIQSLSKSLLVALFLGDINAVLDGIIRIAGELDTLGLSREMEAEADKKGMELIIASNINPHGVIRIFEKLTQEDSRHEDLSKQSEMDEENATKLFSYFSTHPSGQDRLVLLKKHMAPYTDRTWTPLFPNLDWNKIKP
jgi:beta-barrel assembly-enhancing protease